MTKALYTFLFSVAVLAASTSHAADDTTTAAPRANVGQNGNGEVIDFTHHGVYAAGLNGRVRPAPAAESTTAAASASAPVRANVAQNGGEAVDPTHAGSYNPGLNGRPKTSVASTARESSDKE